MVCLPMSFAHGEGQLSEDPLENRADVLEVVAEVEALLDFIIGQQRRYFGVGFQQFHQRQFTVRIRSEEHTSELQSLMRISYAVFCLKKKNTQQVHSSTTNNRQHIN